MILKYGVDIEKEAVIKNLDRMTNRIFKLLPNREEGGDWQTPLKNLILELVGMDKMLGGEADFFYLLSKMEALLTLEEDTEDNFIMFRKNIFECLKLINDLKQCLD